MAEAKKRAGEVLKSVRDVRILRRQTGFEGGLQGSVIFQRAPNDPKQDGQIAAGIESVIETAQAT